MGLSREAFLELRKDMLQEKAKELQRFIPPGLRNVKLYWEDFLGMIFLEERNKNSLSKAYEWEILKIRLIVCMQVVLAQKFSSIKKETRF